MLLFSDGYNIDTAGALRPLHMFDGWYVVGQGMSIPVDSIKEALQVIAEMTKGKK
jgi:hypothetical protein